MPDVLIVDASEPTTQDGWLEEALRRARTFADSHADADLTRYVAALRKLDLDHLAEFNLRQLGLSRRG